MRVPHGQGVGLAGAVSDRAVRTLSRGMRLVKRVNSLTVVIQAGGESRRMGRSKATVPFLGEPLLWRGIRRLMPVADEFIITTNEPQNLAFLDELVQQGRIRLVTDLSGTRGALHGINTALSAATCTYVALVACDMVSPSPQLIEAEAAALDASGADVVVPKTKFGYEPFHGVYRRETCLTAVRAALAAGETKATGWFDRVTLSAFTTPMVEQAVPCGGCFTNVNTPEELAHAERIVPQLDELERQTLGT